MLGRWSVRRVTALAAVLGLALGLAALAALTIWGAGASRAMTDRVRGFNEAGAHWNLVFVHLNEEDAALREFLATGGSPPRREPLQRVIGSANVDLEWLKRHGDQVEISHVDMLTVGYADYTRVLTLILESPEKSDELSDYGALALLEIGPLRDQVVANVERKQRELAQYLVAVDRDSRTLRWVTGGVVTVDLLLCVVSMAFLVANQQRAEREAFSSRHQALHDALTGLANRQLLADRIGSAIQEAGRTEHLVGLLLVDLDRFKAVNDTLGHQCGDLLLQQVAQRLVRSVRETDTVARLGGDEFAVLLPDLDASENLSRIAGEIRRAVQQPVELNGLMVDFGASIGASVYPDDSATGEELLRHADVAMYVAKRGGLGVNTYDRDSDAYDPRTLSMLSELRHGIERGELVLYYQPKASAFDRSVLGVEALVRWYHPSRGMLAPQDFLPIAERGELIEQLTDAVLQTAIRQAGHWVAAGTRLPVSVNVAARSVLDSTFPSRVAQLLEIYDVPPDLLTVELTESVIAADPQLAAKALQEVRALGVHVSIDDFGAGYSSMAFLRDIPVDEVKIDRGFVTTMRTDERNHLLVKAMVVLARNLMLTVVAEGVEDELTLETLRGLGCQVVQGYYIGEPMPPGDLGRWLDGQSSVAATR
ncbi:MAG: EAL domain-containing protein [Dactylosporangium sp.]|nr:EAL domain-containing protein [Dactylosporangium sp.]NNJ61094.1 EAL domain-containing protein [Dactylosporangium sp.]